MSSMLKGKTRAEAEQFFELFHRLVTRGLDPTQHHDGLGKLAVFAGVSEFPARVKCASLAWHTMRAALEEKEQTVTTE